MGNAARLQYNENAGTGDSAPHCRLEEGGDLHGDCYANATRHNSQSVLDMGLHPNKTVRGAPWAPGLYRPLERDLAGRDNSDKAGGVQ